LTSRLGTFSFLVLGLDQLLRLNIENELEQESDVGWSALQHGLRHVMAFGIGEIESCMTILLMYPIRPWQHVMVKAKIYDEG